jgi:hypothetical protein
VLPVTEGVRLTLVHRLLEHEGDEAVPVGHFAPALRQMLLKALLSEEFLVMHAAVLRCAALRWVALRCAGLHFDSD